MVTTAFELALPVKVETGSVCFAKYVCLPSDGVRISDQEPPAPTSAVPTTVEPS